MTELSGLTESFYWEKLEWRIVKEHQLRPQISIWSLFLCHLWQQTGILVFNSCLGITTWTQNTRVPLRGISQSFLLTVLWFALRNSPEVCNFGWNYVEASAPECTPLSLTAIAPCIQTIRPELLWRQSSQTCKVWISSWLHQRVF